MRAVGEAMLDTRKADEERIVPFSVELVRPSVCLSVFVSVISLRHCTRNRVLPLHKSKTTARVK